VTSQTAQPTIARSRSRTRLRWSKPSSFLALFDFDQRAGKILRVQEQHRLAVRADLGHAVAEHPRTFFDQGIAGSDDVADLITDVMNAAVGIAFQEFRDRRRLAKRLDEFDLGVG